MNRLMMTAIVAAGMVGVMTANGQDESAMERLGGAKGRIVSKYQAFVVLIDNERNGVTAAHNEIQAINQEQSVAISRQIAAEHAKPQEERSAERLEELTDRNQKREQMWNDFARGWNEFHHQKRAMLVNAANSAWSMFSHIRGVDELTFAAGIAPALIEPLMAAIETRLDEVSVEMKAANKKVQKPLADWKEFFAE